MVIIHQIPHIGGDEPIYSLLLGRLVFSPTLVGNEPAGYFPAGIFLSILIVFRHGVE